VRYRIAPSLLAADFAALGEAVRSVDGHADMLHLDVMDGHFVPNLTFGLPVIAALRPHTDVPFDCHVMTSNPAAFLPELADAGVDLVTIHIEAASDPSGHLARARDCGMKVGLAISPPTPFGAIEPFADDADLLLVMSVNPGFGGQEFIPEVLGKVEAARKWVERTGSTADIEIDGGVGRDNIRRARDAGANVFVAGTSVFRQPDPALAIESLRELIGVSDE